MLNATSLMINVAIRLQYLCVFGFKVLSIFENEVVGFFVEYI